MGKKTDLGYDAVEKERHLLRLFFHDVINGVKPDAAIRLRVRDVPFVYELRRAQSAHGGYVVVIQTTADGSKSGDIHYLSDLIALANNLKGSDPYATSVRHAVATLEEIRNRVWRGERVVREMDLGQFGTPSR